MSNRRWAFALALALSASTTRGGDEAPAPPSSPSAAPRSSTTHASSLTPAPRLKIDIGRAIAEALARDPTLALPHFEEKVDVRDEFQARLGEHLRGVDIECGAAESAPPVANEMKPYRGATIPPHADFIGPAKLTAKRLKKLFGSRNPRYFLYAIHSRRTADDDSKPLRAGPEPPRAPGATTLAGPQGESVSFTLRDRVISENDRSSVPGTSWELIAGFRERDDALAALDRLRRGFSMQRAHEDGRLAPWVSTTCRPRRAP